MKFRPKVPSSGVSLERLEQRQVLSAAIAAAHGGAALQDLISVSPRDGEVVSESDAPSAIVIHLSNGLIQSWLNKTVMLYKLGDDGTATPVFGGDQLPEPANILDLATNTVTMSLDGPLEPGRYRVALLGGFGSFSHLVSNGAWDYMEDQTLAEFEVVGGEFGSPINVGAQGPVARTFSGALTSAGDQALYKFSLDADQPLWRLGLQLDAERLGGGLLATLTVYDAHGNVVASSEGRRGLAPAPNDPYLFVGLPPGTYYVGVSPAAGARGLGSYRLSIAADPVVGPTRVTGFTLDWTRGVPTGFTITFSDAIAPEALGAASVPLWVVDAGGAIHRAVPSAAADGFRRLSFVFEQPPPAGKYTLVAPEGGGLVDLINRAPRADGLPPGLLAKWTVAPYQADTGPAAPGASWLDRAKPESLIDNAVGSGGALTLRFGVGAGTAPSGHGSFGGGRGGGGGLAAPGASGVDAPGTSFIGVLDSSLFGRPAARTDGAPSLGSVPPRGHALLASVARERLAGERFAPSPADDGLPRSPNGALEIVGPTPTLPAETAAPRLVEFPRGEAVESTEGDIQADVEALERIEDNQLVDASARVIQWLFGATIPGERDNGPLIDRFDAQMLAQLDAEELQSAEDAPPDEPTDQGASRAGLGVPIGVVVLLAVAYRLHRRPPRWWRRRRPAIEGHGQPPRPAVPRGPRFMVSPPGGTAARSRVRSR